MQSNVRRTVRNCIVIIASCSASALLLNACGHGDESGVGTPPPASDKVPPDPLVKAKYDGTAPNSLIMGKDGYLYGTTTTGGDYGYGSVFRISPDGVETVIHSFNIGPAEGANPIGLIQATDDFLYGTTSNGGTPACPRPAPDILFPPGHNIDYSGCGTVFKLSLQGELTVLHYFTGGQDGNQPIASLVESSPGRFYGETLSGGLANSSCTLIGCGLIFSVDSTGDERTVHAFNIESGDGALPAGLTLGKDGNLYGTAGFGGAYNQGLVFKLTPQGAQTVLFSFMDIAADGNPHPNGPPVQGSDGSLYGTTLYGGASLSGNFALCEFGCGTIYKISPTGEMSIVYAFVDVANGVLPQGTLIAGTDGTLLGIASYGGNTAVCQPAGCGTVFQLTHPGAASAIYEFDQPVNGTAVQPRLPSSLIQGGGGYLYGTADGGDFGEGIVFKISPTGVFTILHSFRGPSS